MRAHDEAERRGTGEALRLAIAWIPAAVATLLCATAAAGPDAYLIKTHPTELGVRVDVRESCKGVSSEPAQRIAEDVLVRSGITPAQTTLLLRITADCLSDDTSAYRFSVGVDFVAFDPDGTPVRQNIARHGSFGHYDEPSFLLEAIKMAAERATTEYLRANFLEPQSRPRIP